MSQSVINYFKMGVLPFCSTVGTYGNKQVEWCHTDTPENFNKNPFKDQWKDVKIIYNFNPQGFRTYDLTRLLEQKINIAIGCSHTLGIGLPADQIWPYMVEQATGIPTLNLGVGGGSSDTVARILTNVVSLYSVQTVYVLWPEESRFERFWHNEYPITNVTAQNAMVEYAWHMEYAESAERYYKNQTIVHMLSKLHNFSVKEVWSNRFLIEFTRLNNRARDGLHMGPEIQKMIAKTFLNT